MEVVYGSVNDTSLPNISFWIHLWSFICFDHSCNSETDERDGNNNNRTKKILSPFPFWVIKVGDTLSVSPSIMLRLWGVVGVECPCQSHPQHQKPINERLQKRKSIVVYFLWVKDIERNTHCHVQGPLQSSEQNRINNYWNIKKGSIPYYTLYFTKLKRKENVLTSVISPIADRIVNKNNTPPET